MEIRPLRAYRYAGSQSRDISAVVAPPYDQISPEMQDRLYRMSPHNIVRVTYPKDAADKYRDARDVLDGWLADGVWERDERPAIYPYHQTYAVGGQSVTRMGFVALGEVSPSVEATAADIGLLFMLTADPGGELRRATTPIGDPIAEARDLKGEHHRLWRLTEEAAVSRVRDLMATRQAIIADGHHRYETAVAYAERHPDARHKLMAFFPLEAPGLTILANHRLVHDIKGFDFEDFVQMASRWFEVSPLADPLTVKLENRAIAVVSGPDVALLRLKPGARDHIAWPEKRSAAWRGLAVSILHEGLLRPLLGITDAKLDAKTHVDYTADRAEAIQLARDGKYQAAFLIAATTVEELQAVVHGGELLPQKSTHFYPKLLDGLVFARLGE